MSANFEDGSVITRIDPENATEELSRLRALTVATTVQLADNDGGLTVKYDVSWMALAVLSGAVPGGVRIIATVLPSPGHAQQNINIGVAVTKYRVFWHLGAGNFQSKDFTAPAGYYYPTVGVIWRKTGFRVSEDEATDLASAPIPKS